MTYTPPTNAYYQKRAEECLNLLLRAQMAGVVICKGVVVEKTEEFLKIFEDFYFESYGRGGKALDVNYFLSEDFTSGVYYLAHDDETFEETVKGEVARADLEGIILVVLRSLETRNATRELDLSKSLIFARVTSDNTRCKPVPQALFRFAILLYVTLKREVRVHVAISSSFGSFP